MYNSNQRLDERVLHDGGFSLHELGCPVGSGKSIPAGKGWKMILFHRTLLFIMLIAAFMQGAIDAGRRELLNELLSDRLIHASLQELGQIKINKRLFDI